MKSKVISSIFGIKLQEPIIVSLQNMTGDNLEIAVNSEESRMALNVMSEKLNEVNHRVTEQLNNIDRSDKSWRLIQVIRSS